MSQRNQPLIFKDYKLLPCFDCVTCDDAYLLNQQLQKLLMGTAQYKSATFKGKRTIGLDVGGEPV